jgi:GT2 family glycosyltransferase
VTSSTPEVSVVVCSVGRPEALELCIDGLRQLEDVSIEIVVVLGPGAATSSSELAHRPEVATIVTSPERNLSLSRNLGADVARGALIAFIDDDAYPSERWLADLVPAFRDPEVGAVGGETLDYTGRTHQAVASMCSVAGDSHPVLVHATPGLTETPAARSFYYPIGTNLVVRSEALRQVGGFDEQFDYYHDETDLARRLLDAGWIVRPVARGLVFHKFLPSAIRGERRIATDRRSIVVNRAYFAARHQAPAEGVDQVRSDFAVFADAQEAELAEAESRGLVPIGTLERFAVDRLHATALLDAWLDEMPPAHRHAPDRSTIEVDRSAVVHNPSSEVLHVALVCPGGFASPSTLALGRSLSAAGCRVHVMEHGDSHTTVDLEGGLWRHRVAPGPGIDVLAGDELPISLLLDEVARTHDELTSLDAVVGDVAATSQASEAILGVEAVLIGDVERCASASELVAALGGRRLRRS